MASDAAVTSGLPLDAAAGFRAFAFIAAVGVGAELLLAAWAFGTSGFRSIRDTIDRQSKKVDALRAAGASASPPPASRAKKADRLEASLKTTLLKEMGAARVKQAVVSAAALMITMTAGSRVFGGKAVVRLPFEPFPLLRGVAHRGLEGHALTDGSWVILFTLVQAGVRPVVAKLLDGGPSRRMNELCQQWGPGGEGAGGAGGGR